MKNGVLKTILLVLVIFGLIVAGGALIGRAANQTTDGYEKERVSFEVGGLVETNGAYIEDKTTLYTKNGVDCDFVKIDIEFDAACTYQLFFYDVEDVFVSATEVLSNDGTYELPEGATSVRIELQPQWPVDTKAEDKELNFLNKGKYTGEIKVYTKTLKEEATPSTSLNPATSA